MGNTKQFIRFINFLKFRSILQNEAYRKEFYAEIALINFGRLRVFSYFLVVFSLSQLYSDFFLSNFWEDRQIGEFMLLDIIIGITSLSVFAITHIKRPKKTLQIKSWHSIVIYTYVFIHIMYGTAISVVEVSSANGVPTYVIGVFAAATIFLMRSLPFILTLLISLAYLYYGLLTGGMHINQIMAQYIQMIPLTVVAWIVSRVLMNTRMRSFSAQKEVEIARDNLDHTVKERTIELEKTNIHLKDEIRERKKYERGLKREKKKAEEADKLKSVFLANMSHEIRTPLNGILGFGDLLETPGLKDEKKKRYIDIIRNNGQQLLKIIDDIMDISMIESNQLKLNNMPFRIQHLFPQAYEVFINLKSINNKEHIKLTNNGFPEPEGTIVVSDPVRIQQVLYNLLSNAIKFSEKGQIQFGGSIEDDIGMIYIEDTGIGVNPNQCRSIFERFRQGHESSSREYGGTGLGLSISQGIIELLSGMIWVDLSYTAGARFCFSVPINAENNIPSGVDLLQYIKNIEEKTVILTSSISEHPAFMDCYINSLKLKTTKLTLSDYVTYSLQTEEPEVIIIDLSNTDITSAPIDVRQILKTNTNALIVTIGNNNDLLNQNLIDIGCKKVFKPRINAHAMFAYIYKYTYAPVITAKV